MPLRSPFSLTLLQTFSLIASPKLGLRKYILQNYNYKLHFKNLFICNIPHVFIGTLAAENIDVCVACDP
jgi:hypothetical protein